MLSIYKASAGSGKTYTLTYRYIRLLLGERLADDGPLRLTRRPGAGRHSSILAITFTNMATGEMKRRILHELAVLAGMEPDWTEPSDYIGDLCRDLRATPGQIAAAAAEALPALLRQYGDFNVSTIDAFFQTVLRTFAREAELTGDYEVELDKQTGVQFAINRLFETASADSNPTQPAPEGGDEAAPDSLEQARQRHWLVSHISALADGGKAFQVFNRRSRAFKDMVDYVKDVTGEQFALRRDEILAWLSRDASLEVFVGRLEECRRRARQAVVDHARNALEVADACPPKVFNSALVGFYGNVIAWLEGRRERPKSDAKIYQEVPTDPLAALTAQGKKLGLQAEAKVLAESLSGILESVALLGLINLIRDNIHALGLLSGVLRNIEIYHDYTSTVLLEDTNALLRHIIGNDSTPFVYERTGLYLRHFLIDEFQDTSALQWANLKPLVAEGVAGGDESLVIGDVKQCIYRFRNSDPELLQGLHAEMAGMARLEGGEGDINWRSSQAIVEFNNKLFAGIAARFGLADIYAGVSQRVSPKQLRDYPGRGYIALKPLSSSRTEERLEGYEMVLEAMRRQLTQGGYRPSDLAVLTRDGSEAASFIEWFLARASLPENAEVFGRVGLVSDDSLVISSSGAVLLVVSLLRQLALGMPPQVGREGDPQPPADAPDDGSRLPLVDYNPRVSAAMQQMFETLLTQGVAPGEALATAARQLSASCRRGEMPLEGMAEKVDCITLPAIVERLCSMYVPQSLRESQAVYLDAFQDLVAEFCATRPASAADFLDWWDDMGYRSKVAGALDPNAIRVLTIHKSKGLEFKCLHIPYLNASPRKGRKVWIEAGEPLASRLGLDPEEVPPLLPVFTRKELNTEPYTAFWRDICRKETTDCLNVLYVAFTRAVDELTVAFVNKGASADALAGSDVPSLSMLLAEGLAAAGCTPGDDGMITIGSPTCRRDDKAGPRSVLDPQGSPEPMPPYSEAPRLDVWRLTKVDSDDGSGAESDYEAARRALMGVTRLASEIDAHLPANRVGTLGPALKEWVESRPEWFEKAHSASNGKVIFGSRGDTARVDRLVTAPDGSVHIINYMIDPRRIDVATQLARLRRRLRLLRRALRTRHVGATLFDPLKGVELNPEGPLSETP